MCKFYQCKVEIKVKLKNFPLPFVNCQLVQMSLILDVTH